MIKTVLVFMASLVITIFASSVFAQSPSYSTSSPNITAEPTSSVQQGVGGSSMVGTVTPNQAPNTGYGGLSQ